MGRPSTADEIPLATQFGGICASAARGQRDLRECAAAYDGMFPSSLFDSTFFSTLALANTFSAPWLEVDELRITNRVALWNFGVDSMVDDVATSPIEAETIARQCLAVADGAEPLAGEPASEFLADIRDEMASAPAFPALQATWREELRRMLVAMLREREWRTACEADVDSPRPTLKEYLHAATDSVGFSFVFVTHWIATSRPEEIERAEAVVAAGRKVERLLRLLNDLATVDRDRASGDLNLLMLGATRADVTQSIDAIVDHRHVLLQPVWACHPRLATFLERQIGFNVGLYRLVDYRGAL